MRFFFQICLFLFLTAPAFSQVKDYVLEGNKLYQKGQYKEAAGQYRQAIEKGQNQPFAWFNLGNCHAQAGDFPDAITAYRRAVELSPGFVQPWLVLGDIYTTYGEVGLAIASYERVLEQDPENGYAWKWLGENALKAGDVTRAMRCFEAALKLDPYQVEIYFALAEAYAAIRDYETAIDVMNEAVLMSPRVKANVYYYLGYLHEQAGDLKKAVWAYEDGLTLEPKNKSMILRICDLQQKMDADFLALLTLESALEAGLQEVDVYLEMGAILFRQERLEPALEAFQKAFSKGSLLGRSGMENVAAAYWNQGDKERSREIQEEIR